MANLLAGDANRETVLQDGALDALLRAMREHPDDARIQVLGAAGVQHVSKASPKLRQLLVEKRVSETLVLAMRQHPMEAALNPFAVVALASGAFAESHAGDT